MNKKHFTTALAVTAGLAVVSIFFVFQNPFAAPSNSAAALEQAAAAPQQLIVQDERVGSGASAKMGDIVVVNYIGKLKEDGTVFDSSYGRTPLQFQIGDSRIIAGLNAGIRDMKVGGKRLIIIPPNLAYGSQQMGPIPPNATLVFEIDLLSVAATTTLPR